MNKQQEAEVKAEAPVETMEDYAAELEASYKAFDERHFELPETDDAEGEKWAEFAQMMADRTVLNVKIAEAVKGGVVAFVNEVIDTIRLDALKDRLHLLVEKRFRGELNKCQGCAICK